jgi:hypothetical protein
MTKRRFIYDRLYVRDIFEEIPPILTHNDNQRDEFLNGLNYLSEENERLKQKIGDLLYQIGEVGKNNKTCRECECFISEIKYCYMWDMEVEADDVVVACDQRKVRKQME